MNQILPILMMAGGLAILIVGADLMIRGVTALATRLGVPAIVIGMTVVAFGTSMPEVAVNLISAFRHQTDLAFGNLVGSCSINIGWVLALTALVRPLKVDAIVIRREIPMMILAAAAFMVMSLDAPLDGTAASALVRTDGMILLLLFALFLYYTTLQTQSVQRTDHLVEEAVEQVAATKPVSGFTMTWMIVVGLTGVAGGAHLAVTGAVTVAQALGIPDNIIGLTLVSFGTTLPELVTCIVAARRGQSEIAIGNVVGSNIFNLLFIGGAVAVVHPIGIPAGGIGDLLMLLVLCLLLLPISIRGHHTITRVEGVFLLVLYLAYTGYRTITAL